MLATALTAPAHAASREARGAERFDRSIDRLSRAHGVPERLIRRVIMRESRYAPNVTNHGHYGLMQIKLETAKGMGYAGGASGLLDGETNLTYAVPYLANAYLAAGRNEDRAVQLYAGGYYYVAKREHLLGKLRTARSKPLSGDVDAVAYAEQPAQQPAAQASNPFAALFSAMRSQPAAPTPQEIAADPQGQAAEEGVDPVVFKRAPLPPKRPSRD
ncbi:MAG: lytic transglycosylase domain-containing protein [Hyphomicrobiales bacterium]|nr:lytic transglycosylase domain-containing protein [Hyphomicrobiales bacterium]